MNLYAGLILTNKPYELSQYLSIHKLVPNY